MFNRSESHFNSFLEIAGGNVFQLNKETKIVL